MSDEIESIAGYRILRRVGAGGMGKVYAAQHPRLPRQDAIKVLSPGYSNDSVFRARFEREGQLAASLEHPHIVPVYDCGVDDGRLWLSMRLINGPTAAEELKAAAPGGLPPAQVIGICTAVARALDFAHSRNLQHRDVKPENILIDLSSGAPHPVLSDFGIARIVGDTSLSSTGMVIGTVDYSAPEHLSGEATDGRADQYSLACTAAYLLTGIKPFGATNPTAVMMRHIRDERPSISALRPDLPQAIDDVFRKALAIAPDERYGSCQEFVTALDRALRTENPTTATPTTAIGSPRGATAATTPVPPQYPVTEIANISHPHPPAPPVPAPPPAQAQAQAHPTIAAISQPQRTAPPPPPGRYPPAHSQPVPPVPPKGRKAGLIAGAVALAVLLVGGGIAWAMLGGSDDDPASPPATAAAADGSAEQASAAVSSAPPRQQYDILNTTRNALDPCRLPANLLTEGGMNPNLSPARAPNGDMLLCNGTLTGNAPPILLGGYVPESSTWRWMVEQYDRGAPAFPDLPGWRRYEAYDGVTRCKYGFVAENAPRYAFELAVQVRPASGGFDVRAREDACNRLAQAARAIDPAMPH
ncbi:putative serine/threonine protein kinase [Gordonia hirsuta DSM 44140 = NBRC 16056]|uniref:non-specific serine/threonine protein kinase n=1 Tax=Gordonia hirsuta DSM 44140 = NBRC 16056 TaxID=1121927 RepID=L7LCB0_9ACTN|nr:protein kinase [Gordonia hirsuta]GAC57673.1 putative serine/threonine protein kinase [Gordonia hirsuta DSM 44140 = NBRC 16056]